MTTTQSGAEHLPPSLVCAWLTTHLSPRAGDGPSLAVHRFTGATLLADIVGFTLLAREFADRHGADGADQLSRVLDAFFGRLVDLVAAHGGHVARLAGDALLAFWPSDDEAELAARIEDASACAVAMTGSMSDGPAPPSGPLSVRVGVGAGPLVAARVGGVGGRYEAVLLGPAVDQLAGAVRRCAMGATQRSGEAEAALRRGQARQARGAPKKAVEPARDPAGGGDDASRAFVHEIVRNWMAAGLTYWLAQLRTITVVFFRLDGLGHEDESLARLQEATLAVQRSLARWHGTLHQVVVDDKGTVVVSAFGLLTGEREYRAADAVSFAEEASAELTALGIPSSAGVATGRVFCGLLGSDRRRDFVNLGPAMNLAARLMTEGDGRLCDATTMHAALSMRFADGGARSLKGLPGSTAAYRAIQHADAPRANVELVGFTAPRELLDRLAASVERGASFTVVFEGEAGSGKSALLHHADRLTARSKLLRVRLDADALARSLPYHPWRRALEDMLGLAPGASREEREARVIEALGSRGDRAALLNPILGLRLPDGRATLASVGYMRAQAAHDLVVELLQSHAGGRCVLLEIDDAQWLDSASSALFAEVRERVQPIGLLVTLRVPRDDVPAEVDALLELPDTHRMTLLPLSVEDTRELLALRLHASEMPERVARWVHARSAGNPFFSLEMADALRADGFCTAQGSGAPRVPTLAELSAVSLPATIEGMIAHHIDRLEPNVQVTLRAASALGPTIEADSLAELVGAGTGTGIEVPLEALAHAGVILPDPTLLGRWRFRNEAVRAVAYGELVADQRGVLHRRAAEHYARRGADPADLARTAYHWGRTDEPERAIEPLDACSAHADRAGAMLEARRFLETAASIDAARVGEGRPGVSALRRATWFTRVAAASAAMGDSRSAVDASEEALRLLGRPAPAALDAWRALLGRASVRHAVHRLLPEFVWRTPSARRSVEVEVAKAYSQLNEAYFYIGVDSRQWLAAMLMAANTSEETSRPGIATSSWGTLSQMANLVGLRRLGDFYLARCIEGAAAEGGPYNGVVALYYEALLPALHGQWDASDERTPRLLELLEPSGSRYFAAPPLTVMVFHDILRGRFALARQRNDELRIVSATLDSERVSAWVAHNDAQICLHEGDLEGAMRHAEAAYSVLARLQEAGRIVAQGVLATALVRAGRVDEALATADEILAFLPNVPLVHHTRLEGHMAPAEVYLTVLETTALRKEAPPASRRRQAEQAVAQARRFARHFPTAAPRHALLEGRLAALFGRPTAARRWFDRALLAARRLELPLDEARAAAALASLRSRTG